MVVLRGAARGLHGSVAEPAVVVGEIAGGFYGLKMFGVGEVKAAFINACGLENVDVARQKSEGNRARDIDTGVLELAFYVKGDRDETAGGRFIEISCPLVDADCADNLFRLGNLVHLGERGGHQRCREEGCARRRRCLVGLMGLLTRLDAFLLAKSS